jgi:Secretion system C-terminal sorting domain
MRQFLTLICLFLIFSTPSSAQLSSVQWLHTMKTPANTQFGDVYPLSLAVDNGGNCTILGDFTSTVVFDNGAPLVHASTSSANDHLMILRYDNAGNLLWKSSIIANADNVFDKNARMGIDNEGNVVVAGRLSVDLLSFGNNITLSRTCLGDCYEIFIAKYNNNGEAQFAKAIQVPNNNKHQIAGIDCDAQGNIYVAGLNGGTAITFEDSPISSTTITNLIPDQQFLAKLGSDGNLIWFRSLEENSGLAICTILRVSANGNAYLSGNFEDVPLSFDNIVTAIPFSSTNAYIVKYNTAGTPLWTKSLSGNDVDILDLDIDAQEHAHIICDVKGNLNVDGQTIATTTKSYLGTILSVDSLNTNVALEVSYAEGSTFPLFTIAVKPNGDFFAAGVFGEELTVGATTLPFPTRTDIAVVAGGNTLPIKAVHFGEGGFENIENFNYGRMIGLDGNGFVYILGTYFSGGFIDTFTLNNAGMFLAKLNTGTVGTKHPHQQEVSASIMPNPNTGSFTLQLAQKPDNGWLSVLDTNGKSVFGASINAEKMILDLNLPNGFYSVTVHDGTIMARNKLVINRE